MNKLSSLFKGPNGDISSKRIFGLWCLIVATIGFFTGKQAPELGVFMGAATLVFIGQAVSKT